MNPAQEDREPVPVQVDPKCIHSALREFFQPLKTNDSRADFFATYRRESEEFDNEYAKKYDEDLNTSLIFAGLFSAVSSVFIIDVQAKLGPDPNQLAATYMQVLIHTLNASLYPNIEPPPAAWSGPGEGVVIVQCLLYASLATSLFAAFVAMLGKQWLNRFVRNKGRTAAEKSWDRQNKLRGMGKWHFHIVMESLPIMLQFALLLLGSSLSGYLWYINRVVATVVLSATASGVIFYLLFTIAGSLCYECPYQTPMSLIVRTIASSFSPRVPRLSIPLTGHLPWLLTPLDRILRSIKSVIRRVPASILVLGQNPCVVDDVIVVPAPLFGDGLVNWQQHREDSKCVTWTMDTSADADVLLFAFRLAADIVWYPEIATSLCSRRVAALFFDCFLDGAVIPGAEERASYIARILTSILNIHACMGYNLEAIHHIGEGICNLQREHEDPDVYITWWSLTLTFHEEVLFCPPLRGDASPGFCIWLSQMILQSIYWRQAKREDRIYSIVEFGDPMGQLVRGRKVPNAVLSNLVLACAVSLGLGLNITDLHISDNSHLTLRIALTQLSKRIIVAIPDPRYNEEHIWGVLRFLRLWIGAEFEDLAEHCMPWVRAVLDSNRPVSERYQIAGAALLLLEDQPNFIRTDGAFRRQGDRCAKVALRYLALHYRVQGLDDVPSFPLYPAATTVALQIIRADCSEVCYPAPKTHILGGRLIRILAWAAEKNRGQPVLFRPLALEIFTAIGGAWLGPWIDRIPPGDKARLIDALGNVLDVTDSIGGIHSTYDCLKLSLLKGDYGDRFESRKAAVVRPSSDIFLVPILFGLCSSQSWQTFIKKSTFSFMSHPSFKLEDWVVWLRHTLKMIANDSRLGIKCMVAKLKELECYDALALVIRSIWLSPDPDIIPHDLWSWVEQETIGLFRVPNKSDWKPLQGYIPIILDTYNEPSPKGTCTVPSEAARSIFRSDWQPDESVHRPDIQRPLHWRVHQVCMMKRLCQVLKREVELEGVDVLDLLRNASNDEEQVSSADHTSTGRDTLYSDCL